MRTKQNRGDLNTDNREQREVADVMFVCSDLMIGGTERHLTAVATSLVRSGWPISVYSLAGRGPLQAELERGGVKVIVPPLDRPPSGRLGIKRIATLVAATLYLIGVMLKRRPRVVHFMLPEAYLVGAPLAILARIPVKIMSRRSLNLYQRNVFVRKIERQLHRSMTAILGNSCSVIDQLKGEGVSSDRLGLIYNGIDLDAYSNSDSRASLRELFGIKPSTVVMCMVANLIAYKGHYDLINALALATKRMSGDWHLLLAGRDDGIGAQLQEQAARAGLAANISFLGSRSDISALLTASDVGILCSHEEGFANAILEGMAARLPMIVTSVGGNSEAVVNGVTGLIVPPKNSERLADAIVEFANDPLKRSANGAAGRERVAKKFGLDRCVAAYDRLYRKLLAGKAPVDIPEVRLPVRIN
jgi:glycosyltransferase involved in cell wall biosynthesis